MAYIRKEDTKVKVHEKYLQGRATETVEAREEYNRQSRMRAAETYRRKKDLEPPKIRLCTECGVDISDRYGNVTKCKECVRQGKNQKSRERYASNLEVRQYHHELITSPEMQEYFRQHHESKKGDPEYQRKRKEYQD